MSWNPDTYLTFDDHRTRPAAELLSRVPHPSPQSVVDLGCGPGNSTALLAARWPTATVEGVDSSQEMLVKARASNVSATFSQADIATWKASSGVDVIFSNAAFHWLDDHRGLLTRLVMSLNAGGCLAFQMPRNFEAPSHTLLNEAVLESGNQTLIGLLRPNPVADVDVYHRILSAHCAHLDIWETTYLHVLTGEDAAFQWVSGTTLVPFASAVDGAQREALTTAYRAKLAATYPPEPDGTTLFEFKRIFVVATGKQAGA